MTVSYSPIKIVLILILHLDNVSTIHTKLNTYIVWKHFYEPKDMEPRITNNML